MGSTKKRSTTRARETEPPHVAADELAAAFDHAPVGMAITDERARLIRVNAAMARMLGHTADELIGKSVVDLTYPDDLTDSVASNERIARGEVASFTLEKRYLHKSGRAVWARVFVST
jgi:PAS domain S-box-containing protein